MKLFKLTLLLACMLVFAAAAHASPTIHFQNGVWAGASNVFVPFLGQSYDFVFKGGTCAQAFGVCDQAHFFFTDRDSAVYASQAFADLRQAIGGGNFDTFAVGCQIFSPCLGLIPYNVAGGGLVFARPVEMNRFGTSLDGAAGDVAFAGADTWLVWAPAGTFANIPEAGSLATLVLGLSAVALRFRRQRA